VCNPITIIQVDWSDTPAQTDVCSIRTAVFMREQQVPEEFEWDGLDGTAIHLLANDTFGRAVGTARMLPDGHIGRVAVVKHWRGKGVGTELIRAMVREARRRGLHQVHLDAQVGAIAFYERLGFTAEGPEFMDAGIAHRHMHLAL
jgi:predicted GNAT family N-acyltransferase